ncbi:MAG: DNA-binding transcriptional regulator Fis [Pseudomonadales bacterium]|nr:DNA-binding transcriptional regulator Fis [Pseudomonadales bacterium]
MNQPTLDNKTVDTSGLTSATTAVDPTENASGAGLKPPARTQGLRESVCIALNNYLGQVESEHISDLYQMVLAEVEAPLLEAVMRTTQKNQTRASLMLGLNRGTLRKKLKQYGLL